jgi:hypothetical protein
LGMCGWFRSGTDIDEMNLTPFLAPDAIAIGLGDFGRGILGHRSLVIDSINRNSENDRPMLFVGATQVATGVGVRWG